jgi:alkanesulfonate monooxygenase SsuD/methylene tetrahydromethanopterin reductase-like flavin-dependent oxidoreductase (luciferase family)/hemerythrin-like domain-containing protein
VPDYGHELTFGAFLTPGNQEPQHVVELAQLAEGVGLDLVTFQDHPYQPAFLDTWTLMSYVAAQTQRITLAGNVLNLPLRQPAVLARSMASLDLLSGGRVELGIGAGGFWDAIEAMGGRRLSPGQAVDALGEAIEIIREVWDTDTRGGVRFHGSYYEVSGAKRGPAPAHRMSVWVGAYKPRMLRLTGRLADGWLPSLSYLQPGQLTDGNALIDRAALEAGREPGAIRRLLNIGGEVSAAGQWAERLADLALTEGTGTFILASDDPDTIRGFAAEVAPAVREQVAAARSGAGGPSSSGRSGASRPSSSGRSGAGGSGLTRPGGSSSRITDSGGPGVQATQDDGTRLSEQRLWDETARPACPAPPPGARYTPAGRAASAELVAVHDMLRAELATVRDLIVRVQKGAIDAARARSELNQMTMRQNNWTMGAYCQSYCRIVTQHHSLEDVAVFPYLRTRDNGLGPVLDRLQEEHRVIHGVLDTVDRALVNYISQSGDTSALTDAADLLTDTLLSHLAYEERELIDPLARYGFYGYDQD